MGTVKLGENMEIKVEVIKKACSMAMKAHKYPEKQYLFDKIKSSSSEVVFSFAGSLSVHDWFAGCSFGDMEVDRRLFPSLKYVGLDEFGRVNEAFFKRFKAVLANPKFELEVKKAVDDRRKVVFTGHSSGGAIAILATVWFLEVNSRLANFIEPLCLTFGSPLVGDRIINIALRREKWSRCFVNFVMRLDIVPRISLSPLSSIEHQLQRVLDYFNQNPQQPPADAPDFYETVVRNASSVANYAACKIMGSTNPLLETASSFIELSPYRPLGTYVFCTGTGKLVEISNADAVLQVLFYSSQLSTEEERVPVAQNSLRDHLNYENYLKECLRTPIVTSLFHLHQEAPPVTSTANVDMDLNDLGLSERASLCLRAAEALEKQKLRNQNTIDGKQIDIEKCLGNLERYKSTCAHKAGYYDAFKSSDQKEDFHANVNRLELAGIWDEIIEMLKRHELPDEFEGQKKWIRLGTRYRRIVEPLDIANYYRHLKNEDTGPYMGKGRPRRYKCTQKWREHAEKLPEEFPGSCFWAEVEELWIRSGFQGTRESILQMKTKAENWIKEEEVGDDVLLENSTFMTLQRQHGLAS
ncbi:lipase PAD [Salix suchowensis]|nr:lipase PAD [Salix suchowensis]